MNVLETWNAANAGALIVNRKTLAEARDKARFGFAQSPSDRKPLRFGLGRTERPVSNQSAGRDVVAGNAECWGRGAQLGVLNR